MRIDLDKKVYSSRQETDSYIYGSADVVGLMCLCVFCGDNKKLFEELKIPAMRLCSAFQKVNFLRDLQQDVNELGRVYFPGFSFEEFDEKVKKELVNNIQSGYNGLMCASVFGSNRATFHGSICATLKGSSYLVPKKGIRYGK